jgi:Fe-S-cluster containining protein
MTFIINAETANVTAKHMEFYTARGCDVKLVPGGLLAIMVHSPCPHLQPNGACDDYDNRPQVCKDYDGRWDPNMREKCQLPKK